MTKARKPSKCLMLIQDGLGDRPLDDLGGLTPLEAAHTPHMDCLVRAGRAGLVDILAPGQVVGTDVGHLVLFGQDATGRQYRRGPMEARGVGFALQPGDVALRFNFATFNDQGTVVDRRAGRIREGTGELVEALNRLPAPPGYRFFFLEAIEHRGVLVIRGPQLSDQISDADPTVATNGKVPPARSLSAEPGADRTARLVNQIVRQSRFILEEHPVNINRRRQGLLAANGILTRGAGTTQQFVNLPQQTGLRIACVSGDTTVLGLAHLVGFDAFSDPGMTANLDTDLSLKASRALDCLKRYDLVYLHLKGCDIAGHDRQPRLKRDFIERTDVMVGEILAQVPESESLMLVSTADHATPCELGEHGSDPVPVFINGGVTADEVDSYGERACAKGQLGRRRCSDLVALVLRLLRHHSVEDAFPSLLLESDSQSKSSN